MPTYTSKPVQRDPSVTIASMILKGEQFYGLGSDSKVYKYQPKELDWFYDFPIVIPDDDSEVV